ncbi:mitochondrial carrier protein [Nitzschia inconspicua]|uniref:Mitochondrial carrier protein n=1 Tax=Nitzschia inconspicua TaxID=303405 RepID=A0A9K3KWS2_9STRA|nr:mitochondrial carrier protein [Nitzschia inconspicua]
MMNTKSNTDSTTGSIILQTSSFAASITTTTTTSPLRPSSSLRGCRTAITSNTSRSSSSKTNSNNSSSLSSFSCNNNSTLHSAIAGYVAGVSGTVVGYPLDSAKVWIQTGGCKNKHLMLDSTNGLVVAAQVPSRPLFTTAWQTLRALYSGVSGPLFTVGMVQSLNFAIYDRTRKHLHQQQEQDHGGTPYHAQATSRSYLTEDSLSGVATAGFASGMTIACITAPLVMIKTNQQITGNTFRQALQESFYRKGRLNLSAGAAGFLPHFIGESVGRSIYYVTYEGLKRTWAANKSTDTSSTASATVSLQERMVCAALSGITCWAAIFPLDSLRSRVYAATAAASAAATGAPSTTSRQVTPISSGQLLLDTIRQMRHERAFYRGFAITVLRAGPVAAAVLPVYDLTLETLSSSSHQ